MILPGRSFEKLFRVIHKCLFLLLWFVADNLFFVLFCFVCYVCANILCEGLCYCVYDFGFRMKCHKARSLVS